MHGACAGHGTLDRQRVGSFREQMGLFSLVSIGAVSLFVMVARRYQRAVGIVFTNQGLWIPRWQHGWFLPWAQVQDVKLKDYGRGATEIELSYPEGRFRLYAKGFSNPYAVSRFVRTHVGEILGSALPVEGEL